MRDTRYRDRRDRTVVYYPAGEPPRRKRSGVPAVIWPGIPIGLAAAIILGGGFSKPGHPAAPHPAAPAPKPVVITHTITKVVHDHPLLSGGQVLIALGILAFLVIAVVAIRRHPGGG
jgi:hypothetical protein